MITMKENDTTMTYTITEFRLDYQFLSNFYPCKVKLMDDDNIYPSVEHAYQAAKTINIAQRAIIVIAYNAAEAKRIGKRAQLRLDWDILKLGIMTDLVYQKFSQNNALKTLLLATGDAILIEGNYWGDKYWGVCNNEGKNHLGIILMNTRAALSKIEKGSI